MSSRGNSKIKVAILGSGNIGSDLMFKFLREPGHMERALLSGIEPQSEGLARARGLGIYASHDGIQPILDDPEIRIVFDATGAHAHVCHAKLLRDANRIAMLLAVNGAGDFLPSYAGNLDIMTASARQVGEVFAQRILDQEKKL
jgi:acetaldehyde dehydrogenase